MTDRPIKSEEFHFTAAATNAPLITVDTSERIVITKCSAMVDNACSVDVGVRVALASATIAAVASGGVSGVVLSHPGVAAGSGVVEEAGGASIGEGDSGDDVRLTSEVPTGGSLRVIVNYFLKSA